MNYRLVKKKNLPYYSGCFDQNIGWTKIWQTKPVLAGLTNLFLQCRSKIIGIIIVSLNLNAQIIYLQETHLSKQEHEKLRGFGYSNTLYISILIYNSVKFDCSHDLSDKEGRYVIVKGTLEKVKVTLVNVYKNRGNNDLVWGFQYGIEHEA
uniref:Uncharacterized protein n=1 Tax=Cyprinodon variegatus TaxID=28743 RepID=A0A3Q2FKZ2_CYPVA